MNKQYRIWKTTYAHQDSVIREKEIVVLEEIIDEPRYKEEDLRKAFEAGRQSYHRSGVVEFPLFHASFPTFESYLNSLHKS